MKETSLEGIKKASSSEKLGNINKVDEDEYDEEGNST
jgi:hypothetical protein